MNSETRNCQNCKNQFTLRGDDFNFYERAAVPPPTFCPECRMRRRMAIRNERALYKRDCDLCNKSVISMYSSESPVVVYCPDCWWSDKWDGLQYGFKYNSATPFFHQFKRLFDAVPHASLYQTYVTDSNYTNYAIHVKKGYLVFGGHDYEDCAYCEQSRFLKDCYDVAFSMKSEFCYASTDLVRCSRVYFSRYAEDCTDSYFLFDCKNLNNCFGCVNLRNKSYCIFNEQYTKESYSSKLKELSAGTRKGLTNFKKQFADFSAKFPKRFAFIKNSVNSIGDNIYNSKNCFYCFDIYQDIEDSAYSFFLPDNAKDCYDSDHTGVKSQLMYEVMSTSYDSKVFFGNRIYGCHDIFYSDDCHDSHHLFGCSGLRKKEYCVLNKQYSKEEYERTVERIMVDMNANPYRDGERAYRYGEFFPSGIFPFAYNEAVASEYFPLSENEAKKNAYAWKNPEKKDYRPTLSGANLPQLIEDINDDVIKEIIGCTHDGKCNHNCTTAFKIIPEEIRFHKNIKLPLPELCPNCRHAERLEERNPLRLHHHKCECAGQKSENDVYTNTAKHFHENNHCPNEFETSYSPDRKEIVYCETCYNAEVV